MIYYTYLILQKGTTENKNTKKTTLDYVSMDFKNLAKIIHMDDKAILKRFGTYTDKGKGYSFIDNNSKILAVAHVDTVFPKDNKMSILSLHNDTMIISPRLDDRLGVYTLLYTLPMLGIEVDVLLTNGEEIGQSSAFYFDTDKKYNWIFSFDRRSISPVAYDYKTDELEKRIKQAGYTTGLAFGSYSDICELDNLKVTGINFGIGYNDEHTLTCHALLSDWEECLLKFSTFYWMFYTTKMPYKRVKKEYPILYGTKSYYSGYYDTAGVWRYYDGGTTSWKDLSKKGKKSAKQKSKDFDKNRKFSTVVESSYNKAFLDDTDDETRMPKRMEVCGGCDDTFTFPSSELQWDSFYEAYICSKCHARLYEGCDDYSGRFLGEKSITMSVSELNGLQGMRVG